VKILFGALVISLVMDYSKSLKNVSPVFGQGIPFVDFVTIPMYIKYVRPVLSRAFKRK